MKSELHSMWECPSVCFFPVAKEEAVPIALVDDPSWTTFLACHSGASQEYNPHARPG